LAGGSSGFADNLNDAILGQFDEPSTIAVDGNVDLVVIDKMNHRIRKIFKTNTTTTDKNALHFDGVDDFVAMLHGQRVRVSPEELKFRPMLASSVGQKTPRRCPSTR
jgi:hypothetical protein